jgi:2-polyprenyl-3-methyl-5-hydroxy-6-metoxy-1,4-benzoquinol methylase
MQSPNVEFYDQIWQNDWYDMERFNPTARHLQRIILRMVTACQPISSLLDVGCGIGFNLKKLSRRSHGLK